VFVSRAVYSYRIFIAVKKILPAFAVLPRVNKRIEMDLEYKKITSQDNKISGVERATSNLIHETFPGEAYFISPDIGFPYNRWVLPPMPGHLTTEEEDIIFLFTNEQETLQSLQINGFQEKNWGYGPPFDDVLGCLLRHSTPDVQTKWEFRTFYRSYTKNYPYYDIEVYPRSREGGIHHIRRHFYIVKIIFKSKMKQDDVFSLGWDEGNRNTPYPTWCEFSKDIPASLPTWKQIQQQLPVGYADTLRQDVDEALYMTALHPLQRKEILDLFENFHHNVKKNFSPQVQNRTFFANDVRRISKSYIWKIAVGPDFIAGYTDGGLYTLVSPDMASKDLEEFLR
jgi:hypothetical protein